MGSIQSSMKIQSSLCGKLQSSAFDVDKIYIATKYLEVDENDNVVEPAYDESKPFDEQSEKYLINELLSMYQLVLQDFYNLAETRASIDTLTSILKKDKVVLVQPPATTEQLPMYGLLPSFQIERKNEFTQGKQGIAVIARHITNTAMTQWAGLRLNSDVLAELGLKNLDCIIGLDGYRVTDWLSAMVNAHVDVAKDPYVIVLNINEITYGTMCLLLRCGLGSTTFSFLPQPILKQFAEIKMMANGLYGVSTKVSDNEIMDQLFNVMIKQFKACLSAIQQYKSGEVTEAILDDMIHMFNFLRPLVSKNSDVKESLQDSEGQIGAGDYSMEVINKLAFDVKRLDHALINYDSGKLETTHEDYYLDQLDATLTQIVTLLTYKRLQKDVRTVEDLVQISQVDTKKFGNNYAMHRNFINDLLNFINDKGPLFYITDMERKLDIYQSDLNPQDANTPLLFYLQETFLWDKLFKATMNSRKILETQLVEATRGFQELFVEVMSQFFGRHDITLTQGQMPISAYGRVYNKELPVIVSKNIVSYLRAQVIQSNDYLRLEPEEVNAMFFGDNTIANRLSNIKTYLRANRNKPELQSLVNSQGDVINDFLDNLQEDQADNKDTFVSRIRLKSSAMNNAGYTEDSLIAAFYVLWECSDKTVKEFVRDIIRYAYYTSWDERGTDNFTHLIPYDVKQKIGYIQDIRTLVNYWKDMTSAQARQLVSNEDFGSIALTIARNFSDDERIVPRIEFKFDNFNDWALVRQANIPQVVSILPSRVNHSEFFTVMQNKKPLFYRLRGFVLTERGDGNPYIVRWVYELAPTLGLQEGNFRVRELDKSGLEASVFSFNSVPYESPTEEEVSTLVSRHSYSSKKKSRTYYYAELDRKKIANADIYDTRQKQSMTDITDANSLDGVSDMGDLNNMLDIPTRMDDVFDLTGINDQKEMNNELSGDLSAESSSEPNSLLDVREGIENSLDEIGQAGKDYNEAVGDLNESASAADIFGGLIPGLSDIEVQESTINQLRTELTEAGHSAEEIDNLVNQFTDKYGESLKDADKANNALREFLCNL